jgi:hypothetical protein
VMGNRAADGRFSSEMSFEGGGHLHTLNFFHIQLLTIDLGVTDTLPCSLDLQFSNV